MKTSGGLLGSAIKRLKRLASKFSDKPANKIDEHVLEHLLLYHGLVGSSPENQRDFKDVRADIFSAIDDESSSEIAIALKLPPLWWEDKLQTIISEVPQDKRAAVVACLLPERSE